MWFVIVNYHYVNQSLRVSSPKKKDLFELMDMKKLFLTRALLELKKDRTGTPFSHFFSLLQSFSDFTRNFF
jgi:hypothetical protein